MKRLSLALATALLTTLPLTAGAAPVAGRPAPSPRIAQANAQAAEKRASSESFGGLHLNLTERDAVRILGGATSRTPVVLEGATGLYVSDWEYPMKGVRLHMASPKKLGSMTVASFTLEGRCSLRTRGGIGVGSSAADIRKAYAGLIAGGGGGDTIVVGSEFMGIIFTLEKGRATHIFVGAGAE